MVELVLREALEADALVRVLHLAALAALLRMQADLVVAVAEVLGRRDPGAGATVVLGREQLPEADVHVVARELAAPLEVPAHPAAVRQPGDRPFDAQREGVGAVAVAREQQRVARF